MIKQRLDETACRLLDWLNAQPATLWELARHNPQMTVKGAVAAAVFIGASFGFEISATWQVLLGTFLLAYLGVAGRDKPQGEDRR